MARIAGINIPQNKVVSIALTYIHEIGLHSSKKICRKLNISERKSLEKRTDDSEKIATKRFETYEKSTEPVIEYYKKLNLLKIVDGERPINQINSEISDIISLI